MANILIMAGHYYPHFSANGSIMKNIVDQLKMNHNIKVIAIKNSFELNDLCEYDGYEIIRVNDFNTCFHNHCEKKKQTSTSFVGKKFYNYLLQAKRLLFLSKKILSSKSIDNLLVRKQLDAIEKINNTFPIDVILPVCLPYENIVSAIKYKKINANVKVLPYQLDHFTESNTLHNFEFIKRLRYNNHIEIEKEVLDNADHYFILPQIEKHMSRMEFERFSEKITVCEHPLLEQKKQIKDSNKINFDDKKCNLVFAGSLNKRKRNPSYLLELLKTIPQSENICFNVFHLGDCNEVINNYKADLSDNLHNYGNVPLNIAFEAMSKADVLINMGVTDGNQVSGKIFDYFAFGKPIVHLYFFDEDPNLVYFEDYPLVLCLKIDSIGSDENAVKLLDFCKLHAGESLSFEEVEKIYYYATPKFVTTEFLKVIE